MIRQNLCKPFWNLLSREKISDEIFTSSWRFSSFEIQYVSLFLLKVSTNFFQRRAWKLLFVPINKIFPQTNPGLRAFDNHQMEWLHANSFTFKIVFLFWWIHLILIDLIWFSIQHHRKLVPDKPRVPTTFQTKLCL